ncbi:hypothetical protein [Humisphaera borealis]|uniref:Uncharacterized protein n=1 Tax=Humisphaera borealis TaxID=2807512 RepID=A0A7M2WRY3_9BACT|nr:hypothetical protein [Humisphaera borealis]QOV87551.1 hypothetical protein IPV69_14765 [Humisphaera borealis]
MTSLPDSAVQPAVPGDPGAAPLPALHTLASRLPRSATKATLLAFAIALPLVFAKSMAKDVNSDEHPYVAAATLWSRYGLTPYQDFHYNHLPTQLLIHGLLYKLTDHLLLASRAFSCLCAAGVVATLFLAAFTAFESLHHRRRWLLSAAVAAIALTNPLFTLATGLAWNHDLPTLLTLLAFLAACRGVRPGNPMSPRADNAGNAGWTALAGVLVSLAFTSRLTFGPAAAILALMLLVAPGMQIRRRAVLLSAFLSGCLLACLPTIWIVAQSPANAIWGNLLFPKLNTAYHADDGAGRITIPGKIGFLLLDLLQRPGNTLLLIAVFRTLLPRVRASADGALPAEQTGNVRLGTLGRFALGRFVASWDERTLILLAAGLWLAGCFPSPIFRQYLYAPMPLFLLLLVFGWKAARDQTRAENWILIVAAVSVAIGCYHYVSIYRLAMPNSWEPMKFHAEGVAIRNAVLRNAANGNVTIAGATTHNAAPHSGVRPNPTSPGRVLTLGPAIPLEGGLHIDVTLATGPYAYRVNPYLTDAQRSALKLSDLDDLKRSVQTDPPAAILTGFSKTLEADIIQLARDNGYASRRLPSGRLLWLRSTTPIQPATQPTTARLADPTGQ